MDTLSSFIKEEHLLHQQQDMMPLFGSFFISTLFFSFSSVQSVDFFPKQIHSTQAITTLETTWCITCKFTRAVCHLGITTTTTIRTAGRDVRKTRWIRIPAVPITAETAPSTTTVTNRETWCLRAANSGDFISNGTADPSALIKWITDPAVPAGATHRQLPTNYNITTSSHNAFWPTCANANGLKVSTRPLRRCARSSQLFRPTNSPKSKPLNWPPDTSTSSIR